MKSPLRRNPVIRTVAVLALALGFFAFAPSTAGAADACEIDNASAEAYGNTMTLTIEPSQAQVGDTVTISGSGYPPNCTLTVTVGGDTLSATTDADGNFSVEWTIPAGTAEGPIDVSTDVSGLVTHATLTVVAGDDAGPATTVAPVTPGGTTGGSGSGILPKTGSQVLPFLGAGIGLLVIGSLLVLANRKRSTAH